MTMSWDCNAAGRPQTRARNDFRWYGLVANSNSTERQSSCRCQSDNLYRLVGYELSYLGRMKGFLGSMCLASLRCRCFCIWYQVCERSRSRRIGIEVQLSRRSTLHSYLPFMASSCFVTPHENRKMFFPYLKTTISNPQRVFSQQPRLSRRPVPVLVRFLYIKIVS